MHLSCYKPSVKEKDDVKHVCLFFSNNKKKDNILIENVHNDDDNSNQILLKQGSIIFAQGEKPMSNAVVDNDINKSNNKNIYHLSLHAKSITIASYYREGTNNGKIKKIK